MRNGGCGGAGQGAAVPGVAYVVLRRRGMPKASVERAAGLTSLHWLGELEHTTEVAGGASHNVATGATSLESQTARFCTPAVRARAARCKAQSAEG